MSLGAFSALAVTYQYSRPISFQDYYTLHPIELQDFALLVFHLNSFLNSLEEKEVECPWFLSIKETSLKDFFTARATAWIPYLFHTIEWTSRFGTPSYPFTSNPHQIFYLRSLPSLLLTGYLVKGLSWFLFY